MRRRCLVVASRQIFSVLIFRWKRRYSKIALPDPEVSTLAQLALQSWLSDGGANCQALTPPTMIYVTSACDQVTLLLMSTRCTP